MTEADSEALAAFESEVRTFLDAYPRRAEAISRFEWGSGEDRAALFDETSGEAELAHIAKVRAWRAELAAAGLSWVTGPAEYGGRGLSRRHQRLLDSMSRGYDVPDSAKLTVSMGIVAPTILAHGTEVAKRSYLSRIFSGGVIGCQLFSEPGAGSDLASVSTRAVPRDDGWHVHGQKVWTSGAHFSDIGLLLCRTSPGPRHQNLTAFVVDMHAPGVEVRPLRQMTGGASFNEVFLDDVRIADDHRLGDEGAGWQVAQTTLMNERANIGGAGLGGARLLDLTRLIAMMREFGVAEDPRARQDFARLVVGLRSAQAFRLRAEAAARAGHTPGPEMSLAKLALVQNLLRLSDFVASILGPRLVADGGEWGAYSWGKFVLGVPGYRLGGGSDEILRNIVAERVLGLPRG